MRFTFRQASAAFGSSAIITVVIACVTNTDDSTDASAPEGGQVDSSTDSSASADAAEPDAAQPDASESDSQAGRLTDASTGVDAGLPGFVALPPPAPGEAQVLPAVAFDGSNYLLTWQEGPRGGSNWMIKATRISQAGAVLDDPAIAVSSGSGTSPQPIFDGTDFVIVWESGVLQGRLGFGGYYPIFGARVSPTGAVLDPAGILVTDVYAGSPSIACGGGNCLVAFTHPPNQGAPAAGVYSTRIDSTGAPIDASPTPLGSGGGYPQVDFDGTGYWVVSLDAAQMHNRWSTVSAATGLVVSSGASVSSGTAFPLPTGIAFDGTNHLVTWTDRATPSRVQAARLATDGGNLDPGGLTLAPAGTWQASEFDGRSFVTTWLNNDAGALILGTRVAGDGSVDPTPFVVATPGVADGGAAVFLPKLVSNGLGSSLVAFTTCRSSPTNDCLIHARIMTTN